MEKERSHRRKRFWILGAGRFGKIAANRLSRAYPQAVLTVVDTDPEEEIGDGIRVVRQDGVRWLWNMLRSQAETDMIVPAIPIHVVYEWMKYAVQDAYAVAPMDIPESWKKQMPHPIRGKIGQIYTSHADFICPDNCPEPKDRCTVTKKPRPKDLFRLLREIHIGDACAIIVRSHQLLPGVGGLYPSDLSFVRETALKNARRPLFLATACRCHGVGNAFRLIKK